MFHQNFQLITKNHNEKIANVSLILGVINVSPFIVGLVLSLSQTLPSPAMAFTFPIIIFVILARYGPFLSIVGLICGILGFKSAKRNFAIVGIVLNLIGLLVPLYYFIFG